MGLDELVACVAKGIMSARLWYLATVTPCHKGTQNIAVIPWGKLGIPDREILPRIQLWNAF